MPFEVLGSVGDVIAGAPTLGQALRQLELGFPLIQSDTEVRVHVHDDEVYLGYRILDPDVWPRRADAELTLSLFHGICLRYGMPRGTVRRAGFEGAADFAAFATARHLEYMPTFGQNENFIALPVRFLSGRLVETPAETDSLAFPERSRALRSQLQIHRSTQSLGELVRIWLLRRMGRGPLVQMAAATDLGLSERSLRRRLADEGTSFHDLLEECRRAEGLALLTRSAQGLAQIAEHLGYSDQTAFSRACTRWYGKGPSRLRAEGLAPAD